MKGLSVILTLVLLLLANHLAHWLKESGKLPADDPRHGAPASTFAKGPYTNHAIRL